MPPERVARRVLGLGLVPLVPLPLVDDAIRRRLLRASFAELAEARGVRLDGDALDVLVEDRSSWLRELPGKLARWPVKRLLGSAGGLLIAKQCLDGTADGALRCEMLRLALDRGLLPARADEVRTWMDLALGGRGHSALSRGALESAGALPPGAEGRAGAALDWMLQYGDGPAVLDRFRRLMDEGGALAARR